MSFNPLPIVITAVGFYLLIKLKFFFVLHPLRTVKKGLRSLKSRGAVRSLCLALAGTLGVGNVFGVCVGLMVGGAGSVFWMLVSVVFASVLKYSEVVLSLDNLHHSFDSAHGGMYYCILSSFRKGGVGMARVYALGVLLLSFFMGAALQSGTVIQTSTEIFDTPPVIVAVLFAALVLIAILGGAKLIEKITVVVIPLTTILYIILTVSIVAIYHERVFYIVELILCSAFEPESAVGGVLGFLVSGAVREGYSRGVLSNEAGAGTSSMAHARSGILNPASAGIMGIIEVVFDTAVLCTLTALAVLLSVPDPRSFSGGMSLIMSAVTSTLGSYMGYVLLFCVLSFAYSTVICWYYYGTEACTQLFGRRCTVIFLPAYLIFVFSAILLSDSVLVGIVDFLMLILTLLTCITLVKNSDRIRALSESGGVILLSEGALKRRIKGSVSSKSHRSR